MTGFEEIKRKEKLWTIKDLSSDLVDIAKKDSTNNSSEQLSARIGFLKDIDDLPKGLRDKAMGLLKNKEKPNIEEILKEILENDEEYENKEKRY